MTNFLEKRDECKLCDDSKHFGKADAGKVVRQSHEDSMLQETGTIVSTSKMSAPRPHKANEDAPTKDPVEFGLSPSGTPAASEDRAALASGEAREVRKAGLSAMNVLVAGAEMPEGDSLPLVGTQHDAVDVPQGLPKDGALQTRAVPAATAPAPGVPDTAGQTSEKPQAIPPAEARPQNAPVVAEPDKALRDHAVVQSQQVETAKIAASALSAERWTARGGAEIAARDPARPNQGDVARQTVAVDVRQMQPSSSSAVPAGETSDKAVSFSGGGEEFGLRGETARPEALRAEAMRIDAPKFDPQRPVSNQIVEAVRQSRDGTIDLTLQPEELGRVRLSLSGADGSLHVMVQSERSDTQDLLRRHISQLEEDFRQLGYTDISFDFGQQAGHHAPDGREPDTPFAGSAGGAGSDADLVDVQQPRRQVVSGSLDLRL
jgi:hypothetical protein